MRLIHLRFLCITLVLIILRLLPRAEPLPDLPRRAYDRLIAARDAESLLAAGRRMRLSDCGVYELELIPGVSDLLAFRILERKSALARKARLLAEGRRFQIWEDVYGVGTKTARKLAGYIDIAG